MAITVTFKKSRSEKIHTVVFPVFEGAKPGAELAALDKTSGGLIAGALSHSPKFKSRNGDTLEIFLHGGSGLSRVILLGMGKAAELDALKAEEAGGKLFPVLSKLGVSEAAFISDNEKGLEKINGAMLAASLANGLRLRAYSFDRYKSKKAAGAKGGKKAEAQDAGKVFEKFELVGDSAAAAKALYERLDCVTAGVFTARDLVNTPPNDLYPESFAKFIADELRPLGVEVEILDEKKMQKMGMGAILAVGMGSARQPRMVIMRWNGAKGAKSAKKGQRPLAFVGKGVTFDTGGISIKPGPGMEEMKMDMGGAAAVVGLMKSLALRKAKADVVGVVGLAENMPSGNAYRPADILKSYSGKTIEVLNTDAEGRLVLADCLTYVQETYDPRFIVDLATLTGAMLVALGHEYCGTFANDDVLWGQLEASSAATGEKLWRMPLDEVWRKDVESPVADIQNISKSGRNAGSCTAAGFLEHFIDEGRTWAHMDIAGTAWRKTDLPTVPKFGSGFGVRLLDALVAGFYEK